jgi:maltose O-acetyltransferase
MQKNAYQYVSDKLKEYSFKKLFLLEIEAYLAWPFRQLPSLLGYIPRFLIYKLLFKRLDSFCFIQPNVYFSHCFNISCGKNFVVNSNSYFHAFGGIEIGDYVLIGPNVVISSGRHEYSNLKEPVMIQPISPAKIVIEDEVWIGANAVIMPGVTLGKGTVVGAGSVVTKSTEPFSIIVGVPAKKIKDRRKL